MKYIRKKIGVLISGRGSNLLALINASMQNDMPFKICCVVASCYAQGLSHAKKFNIPNFIVKNKDFATKKDFESKIHNILQSFEIEIICLAGFIKIISEFFIEKWQNRIINIHPSLLPLFKGLYAQQQALDGGVNTSGCTVHFVDKGVDTGEIILQQSVPVMPDDTVKSLSDRILLAEHECYPKALKMLCEEQIIY